MKMSLPGLFKNTEVALRSSTDEMACASAFSLGELIDNLKVLKDGNCTLDEFFACYVFDAKREGKLADSVDRNKYRCMQDEPEDEEVA